MFSTAKDDDLVECPYNKHHQIARKRFQTHIIKCRISYPDAELCKCPFNASHLVPEPEFTYHVTNCPDKALITQYKYNAVPLKTDEDHKQDEVECDENWDDTEAKDYDPVKYASQANVIRTHIGDLPSSRREFRRNERKRLGDADSSEDEDIKNGQVRENGWYEDRVAASTSSLHHRESYNESLKKWSKERGLDERDKHQKRVVKEEKTDSEEEQPKKRRQDDYPLDEDPYYKSNNRPSVCHGSRDGNSPRRYSRGAVRKGRY